jgi:hypothetical protein
MLEGQDGELADLPRDDDYMPHDSSCVYCMAIQKDDEAPSISLCRSIYTRRCPPGFVGDVAEEWSRQSGYG